MKGISFWELPGASWSWLRCSKGSLSPQTQRAVSAQRVWPCIVPPLGSLPMNHGLQGCVKSDWAFGSFPQGMGPLTLTSLSRHSNDGDNATTANSSGGS